MAVEIPRIGDQGYGGRGQAGQNGTRLLAEKQCGRADADEDVIGFVLMFKI